MIAIETMDGSLIKIFKDFSSTEFGLHQFFGFTTTDKANISYALKKRQGHDFIPKHWLFTFNIRPKGQSFEITVSKGCEVRKLNDDLWLLDTVAGSFRVAKTSHLPLTVPDFEIVEDKKFLTKTLAILTAITLAMMAGLTFLPQAELIEAPLPDEAFIVKIVQPPRVVNVAERPSEIAKAVSKQASSMKNLGFLGLIGDKNLKRNVHGAPTKLTKASAGAGPGGEQGSGGEMLVGLGQGLKKTTVGNTGVAGLGGVGTKGAGGGLGGYGNSLVASGNGKGLQELSITNSDMVLDGGLSKYAINATIAKYLNQVRRCYEDELKLNPALEGLVTVDFEVGPAGKLNYAKTGKSTLDNKKVQGCINQKMMTWEFPKPKGGVNVKVSYPFMLRPVGT